MNLLNSLILAALLQQSPVAADSPVGKQIADFKLQDFRGAAYSLAELRESKLVVVAFLGNECPLAKAYAPRLVELQKEFGSKGVGFLAINSNQQDTPTGIAAFARVHKIEFALLKDPGNTVADQFGAKRTPEVSLLDSPQTQEGRVRV